MYGGAVQQCLGSFVPILPTRICDQHAAELLRHSMHPVWIRPVQQRSNSTVPDVLTGRVSGSHCSDQLHGVPSWLSHEYVECIWGSSMQRMCGRSIRQCLHGALCGVLARLCNEHVECFWSGAVHCVYGGAVQQCLVDSLQAEHHLWQWRPQRHIRTYTSWQRNCGGSGRRLLGWALCRSEQTGVGLL